MHTHTKNVYFQSNWNTVKYWSDELNLTYWCKCSSQAFIVMHPGILHHTDLQSFPVTCTDRPELHWLQEQAYGNKQTISRLQITENVLHLVVKAFTGWLIYRLKIFMQSEFVSAQILVILWDSFWLSGLFPHWYHQLLSSFLVAFLWINLTWSFQV